MVAGDHGGAGDRRDVRGHGEDDDRVRRVRRDHARHRRPGAHLRAASTAARRSTEDVVKKGDRVTVKLHRPRRARTPAPVDEGARAEARRHAGRGAASAAAARAATASRPRSEQCVVAAIGRVAVAVVGAAESARADSGDAVTRRRRGAPPDGAAEWTDRALGIHAGSAVGRVRGLGARRRRCTSRASRWACRTCSSTWCSRARATRTREADRARARGARRLARRVHVARAHRRTRRACSTSTCDVAADVIGDLVFDPLLRDADLELERKVVLEEIAMVDDTPDDLVFELHNEPLWGAHPYGYSILGTRETVAALGVARPAGAARARVPSRRSSSWPRRATWTHDELLDVARAHRLDGACRWRRGAAHRARRRWRSRRRGEHVARDGAQTHVVVGSATVPHGDPRRYALILLSMLLGGGMSSRLFQRVREELGLAYAVYTFQSFHADVGMHGVYVGTAPETAREALRRHPSELARRRCRTGCRDDELAMGKSQLKGQITLSLESVTARMYRAAGVELYGEPYRTLDEMLALVDAVDGGAGGRAWRASTSRPSGRPSCSASGPGRAASSTARLAIRAPRSGRSLLTEHIADHEDRRSERDQDQREPHRPRAGRRRGAGRARATRCSSRPARGWAAASPTRTTPCVGAQIAPDADDGLARQRDDHEGEGADRAWSGSTCEGASSSSPTSTSRPTRSSRARTSSSGADVRRVRDRGAADARAAAADADVGGRRAHGGAGGREVPREAVRRPRRAARRRARAWRRPRW